MSENQKIDFTEWTKATGNLKAGEQRAFLDVLHLAADGQITLVYGTDNYGGGACLVNACRQMLATTQSDGITPSMAYGDVVSAFDRANKEFEYMGLNEKYYVSETAALSLIKNFGQLKPLVIPISDPAQVNAPYREKSDEEFAAWLDGRTSVVETDVVDIPAPEPANYEIPLSETREFL